MAVIEAVIACRWECPRCGRSQKTVVTARDNDEMQRLAHRHLIDHHQGMPARVPPARQYYVFC